MQKINYLFYFFLTVFLAFSCSSPKKMIIDQEYDSLINRSVNKLIKKPDNAKEIANLKDAFSLANTKDFDRINFLISKGDPDIWEGVYKLYLKLKHRQANIARLAPSVLSRIGFEKKDYDTQIIAARNRAADFAYSKGEELLNRNDKLSAREAFYFYKKTQDLIPSYPNLLDRLEASKFHGTSFVYITIKNNSDIVLPKDYAHELTKLMVADIGNEWLVFTEAYDSNIRYDYYINLDIKEILISPDALNTTNYTESKKIEDGWKYVLDANGNVKKDANGNDMKQKVIKQIHCYVTKYTLHKAAKIKGMINAYNHQTKQLLIAEPLFSESVFNHDYAEIRGDKRALTTKSKKLANKRRIPFPTDIEIILQTNQNLKNVAKSFINRNSRVFI